MLQTLTSRAVLCGERLLEDMQAPMVMVMGLSARVSNLVTILILLRALTRNKLTALAGGKRWGVAKKAGLVAVKVLSDSGSGSNADV